MRTADQQTEKQSLGETPKDRRGGELFYIYTEPMRWEKHIHKGKNLKAYENRGARGRGGNALLFETGITRRDLG